MTAYHVSISSIRWGILKAEGTKYAHLVVVGLNFFDPLGDTESIRHKWYILREGCLNFFDPLGDTESVYHHMPQ